VGAGEGGATQQVPVNGARKGGDGGDTTLFGPRVDINANQTAQGGSLKAGNIRGQVNPLKAGALRMPSWRGRAPSTSPAA